MTANPFTAEEREALRPRPHMLPADWAEAYVHVPDGEARGPFRKATMPLLTSVINSIVDPRYESVAAAASTQSGKSLALNQIAMGYFLEYARAHTAFGVPNKALAQRVHRQKLKPMFDAVPALRRLFPTGGAGSRGGIPTTQTLRNGAMWMFLGAGSAADMAQATVQNLICDETDKADVEAEAGRESHPIEQMVRRTDAYQLTRKLIYTCTVTVRSGYIHRTYEAGTRGVPWYRCPYCGEWFWWEWSLEEERLGWDDDTSDVGALHSAWYPCPHCGTRLREEDRVAILRAPLWVHEGERIEQCTQAEVDAAGPFEEAVIAPLGKDEKARRSYRVVGERKRSRAVTWWWNKLVSPFVSLGSLAVAVRAARDDDTRRHGLCIYDMALPWEGDLMSELSLDAQRVAEHATWAEYRLGRLPIQWTERTIVTVGVDLHGAWATWCVDAWRVDEAGALVDSWLVDLPRTETRYGQVGHAYPNPERTGKVGGFLEEVLRPLCLEGWEDATGARRRPAVVAIDAGWQDTRRRMRVEPHEKDVYAFCARYGQRTWRAIKGSDSLAGGEPIEMSLQGKRGNRRVLLTAIDRDVLNSEVHEQELAALGAPGCRYLPRDAPAYYARSICAERRVVEFDGDNRPVARWERHDRENHLFDARVYSWAAARMAGVRPPRHAPAQREDEA